MAARTDNPARQDAPAYVEMTYTLAAGDRVEIARPGNFVGAIAATGDFRLGLDAGALTRFRQGLTYEAARPFRRVVLENDSGATNSITLAIGLGRLRDARLSLTGTINTAPQSADTFTTGAAVSAADAATTLLAAANARRREILVASPAGAGTVYLAGASSAAAGEGLPLAGGQMIVLTTTAAVYARNDTGAAVALHVAEIEESP